MDVLVSLGSILSDETYYGCYLPCLASSEGGVAAPAALDAYDVGIDHYAFLGGVDLGGEST